LVKSFEDLVNCMRRLKSRKAFNSMPRHLLTIFMIAAAVMSLGVVTYTRVPVHTTTTFSLTTVETAVNPEILLDYSETTVTCLSTVCYKNVVPYTTTETWSAQTIHTVPVFSTSYRLVPFAISGLGGNVGVLIGLILLAGSVGLTARKRFIKHSSNLIKRGMFVEYLSLAWVCVEAVGAIVAGIFSNSLALLAFGGDSIIEFASSLAVLSHLRTEYKGKGSEEKTRRTERTTALLLFSLIPVMGLGTVYAYLVGVEPESSNLGILIAVGAVVIMPMVWLEKDRVGKRANSSPLSIDAVESATCFLMSAALLVGLLANYLWKLWWVDYLATLLILFFIGKESIESFRHLR